MRYIGNFVHDWREWGLGVAWGNLRFLVGYDIGGFTHAEKRAP